MEAANSAETNMAIFDLICEIVVDPKFIEAQNTFLESNMSLFDEKADENKLEYTSVFASYIHILDELIDSRLRESFSEDQIESFYENYAKKQSVYKGKNKSVHETLFAFVDFTKFRDQMISYKKANSKMTSSDEKKQSEAYILNMAKYKGENGIFDKLI